MIWQSARLFLTPRLLRHPNISSDSPSHQTVPFSPYKSTGYCVCGALTSRLDLGRGPDFGMQDQNGFALLFNLG